MSAVFTVAVVVVFLCRWDWVMMHGYVWLWNPSNNCNWRNNGILVYSNYMLFFAGNGV